MAKQVSAGVILRNGRVLIGKRPEGKPLAGYWEFPGGKQEPGETIEQCLAREIREELGVKAIVGEHLMNVTHQYADGELCLHIYFCSLAEGEEAVAKVHQELVWAAPEELDNYVFPPADVDIIAKLKTIKF